MTFVADRLASPSPPIGTVEGDLRPVTVLFGDVRGFTRLAEVLAPEKLVSAINGCFDILDEVITRYGGEVDKFLGDGVMATFGAPVAHADDPRRAVLAALDMQAALSRFNTALRKQIGCELEMRIGINTGIVLAGPIGSQRKRAYTVMGDAVNVASRLERVAPVGSILIGEATRAHLGSAFRLRLRRSVRLRGRDAPVRSYIVLGQSTQVRRRAGYQLYLGRSAELKRIQDALDPIASGRRAVVEVEGGMGVGKSALMLAAHRGPAGRGRAWLTVACPPYGQDLPYTTLAGLLRGLLARVEHAPACLSLESVLEHSPEMDGVDTALAAAVVRDLLAHSMPGSDPSTHGLTAQLRKGLLARATKALLLTVARRRPLVLVLDDCHWLDAPSAVIVEEAIGDLADAALGWVIVHRPGWLAPPAWAVDTRLRVDPLSGQASADLAWRLLGRAASEETVAFVVERAEGNPLYLVELCGAVAECGPPLQAAEAGREAADGEPRYLTDQLRSLILSRVDGLDEMGRRAVHVAAVLGHAFPARLLRRVLGAGDWADVLARLEEQGMLVRESRARGDGTGSTWIWHFRHPLVQETVYASLLSAARATLHRVAGDALEQMTDAAIADRLALLALHFGRSDDRDRAVRYLCAAGDRARALYLNREAIHYYEDALARLGNTGTDREQRAHILAALGTALEVLAEDEAAMNNLQAAVELETRPEVQSDLRRQLAEIHRRRGTYAAAHEELARAEACIAGLDNPLLLARVRIARAMLAVFRGTYAEARLLGAEAIALLTGTDSPLDVAAAYRAVGVAAAREEDLGVAGLAFTRALESAREGNDALLSATISVNLATTLHLRGESGEARELYRQALAFYERIGAKRGIALACNNLGDLTWQGGAGDWPAARGWWERAMRLYEAIGDQRGIAIAARNMGEGFTVAGEPEQAEPHLRRAQRLSTELGDPEIIDAVERALVRLWASVPGD